MNTIVDTIQAEANQHFDRTATHRRTARVNTADWDVAVDHLRTRIDAQPIRDNSLLDENYFTVHLGCGYTKVVSDPTVPPGEIRWETL